APPSAYPDMLLGALLTAEITPPGLEGFSPGTLRFNELTAASPSAFRLELVNIGSEPLDTTGFIIRRSGPSPDAFHVVAPHVLQPGEFLVLAQATLGFGALPGDKLFLLQPGSHSVADSIEVHERPRSPGPDGRVECFPPATVTLGAANTVSLHDELVFNEIFYHGPPTLEVPA